MWHLSPSVLKTQILADPIYVFGPPEPQTLSVWNWMHLPPRTELFSPCIIHLSKRETKGLQDICKWLSGCILNHLPSSTKASHLILIIIIILSFSRAAPTAHGGSQARGSNWSRSHQPTPEPQQRGIRAASASHTTAHGNAGSLTHWARPGIKPATSWCLIRFVNCWATVGTPDYFYHLKSSLLFSLYISTISI